MTAPSGRMGGHLRAGARALRGRNIRLYLAGSTVSIIGSFVHSFALWWLVLSATDSRTALPVVVGIQTAPILLLGPWGGSVVDRVDNKRLLTVTTVVNTVLAVVLGVLAAAGSVGVLTAYVFAGVIGLLSVLERPALQAILSEYAQPDEIASAVGLNAMIAPTARLVGPPVAALLIGSIGIAWCFFVNAASFLVFLVALAATRRAEMLPRRKAPDRTRVVRDGVRYARTDPVVGPVLLAMFLVGFAGFNFAMVIPLMTKYTFDAGEGTLALVLSASAVGSLLGGAVMTTVRRPDGRMIAAVAVAFGASLVANGLTPTVAWWVAISVVTGVLGAVFPTMVVSLLQQAARPDMLGRVMALNTVAFFGTTPLGAVFVAWLNSTLGARSPFVFGGIVVALTAVVPLRARHELRRRELQPAAG